MCNESLVKARTYDRGEENCGSKLRSEEPIGRARAPGLTFCRCARSVVFFSFGFVFGCNRGDCACYGKSIGIIGGGKKWEDEGEVDLQVVFPRIGKDTVDSGCLKDDIF